MQEIKITNNAESALIEIEGTIGVPEAWQFEDPQHRVATYEKFRQSVDQIELLKASKVIVNIRSTGGDVNDALLIYDALVGLNAEITTRCWGYVASAATVIAQAGDEGKREISPNSLYLVHHSTCSAEGNASDLKQRLDLLQKTDERLAELYATRSGRDIQFFTDLMGEENGAGRWLSAKEAIEAGLADAFVENAHDEKLSETDGEMQSNLSRSDSGIMTKVKGLLRRIGEEIGFVEEETASKSEQVIPENKDEGALENGEEASESEEKISENEDERALENGEAASESEEVISENEEKRTSKNGEAASESEEEISESEEAISDEEAASLDKPKSEDLPQNVLIKAEESGLMAAQASILALAEGQTQLTATKLLSVEDPSLIEQSRSANASAYERDARRLIS